MVYHTSPFRTRAASARLKMTVRFAEYGTLDSKNFLRGQVPNRLLAPATMQRT